MVAGNINRIIEERILKTLNTIVRVLSGKGDEHARTVISKINETMGMLARTPRPAIPTKNYVDALAVLLRYIVRLRDIAEEYASGRVLSEDLYRALREYEERVHVYTRVSARERLRTHVFILLPPLILAFTLFYAALAHILVMIMDYSTLNLIVALLLVSVLLARYNIIASNTITALVSLTILALVMMKSPSISNPNMVFLAIISILVLASSISYIHISYLLSSPRYMSRIDKTLKEILEESRKPAKEERDREVDEIETKLKEIYRSLYGEKGLEYLSYKMTILMISRGISRKEALKKLYDEVKEIRAKYYVS